MCAMLASCGISPVPPCDPQPIYLENLQAYLRAMAREGAAAAGDGGGEVQPSSEAEAAAIQASAAEEGRRCE